MGLWAPAQLSALAERLTDDYKVYMPAFSGHGGRQIPGEPFSIALFAADVLQFMDGEGLDKVSVFGYSMGGYVGMYLAKYHPERINKVVTLATKYNWDEAIAAKEAQMLNPEKIEQKVPAFAETLRKLHAPEDWKQVLLKTAEMMMAMGKDNPLKPADYSSIACPVLLLLGDRDKMVTLDETIAVYKSLANAQMGMLPGTQHPIEQVDVDLLAWHIKRYL